MDIMDILHYQTIPSRICSAALSGDNFVNDFRLNRLYKWQIYIGDIMHYLSSDLKCDSFSYVIDKDFHRN